MAPGRRRLRVLLVLAGASAACGTIEGLSKYEACPDGCGDGDASGRDGATGSSGGDATQAQDGGEGADSPGDDAEGDGSAEAALRDVHLVTDAPVVDGTVPTCGSSTDESMGVFVTPGGTDGTGCGTSPSQPCRTVGAGIAAATKSGRSIVYVAAGTYSEEVKLAAGITVEGGWDVSDSGPGWTYDCEAPESLVVVEAPSGSFVTVLADAIGGAAALTTLTVLSKAQSSVQLGESVFGIFARGASTQLTLNDVVVNVVSGGDGKAGATGSSGSAPSSCSPGDGASHTTAGAAGTGATAGTFSTAGFTPQTGGTGGSGGTGDNGTAGTAAIPMSYEGCNAGIPCTPTLPSCTGGTGQPGCGGGGGGGGAGGTGGGASVALFVFGAQVTVNGGSYTAGSGGAGGAGGNAGMGASGAAGAVGTSTQCTQSACGSPIPAICQPTIPPTVTATGGAAGGHGGQGGNGGQGGGGSGGDAYAVVTAGNGSASLNGSPDLAVGTAGTSLGNGAPGTSGTQGQF